MTVSVSGEVYGSYSGTTEVSVNSPVANVSVTYMDDAAVPAALSDAVGLSKISHVYNVMPDNMVYPQPSNITFTYDPALLPAGISENELAIYEHVGAVWTKLPGLSLDTANHRLTAQITEVHSLFAVFAPEPAAPETGVFVPTGNLSVARYAYSSTLLPSGKVLIAGGQAGALYGDVNIAELYDPASGTFEATGSMLETRDSHNGVLLPDGKVLIVGGVTSGAVYNQNGELYDPATGIFSQTGSMSIGRYGPAALLLPNGKVLVAGGRTTGNIDTASAEIYDPATGLFAPTGSMNEARTSPGYALLPDGKVLLMGGSAGSTILRSAEIYDPETGSFSYTGQMGEERYWAKATLLAGGKVLVVGGTTAGAELYDQATGAFSATGAMNSSHLTGVVVKLASGNVLVAGGVGNNSSAEIYNTATGEFGPVPSMLFGREWASGVRMNDGRVLVAGGYGTTFNSSTELFVPGGSPVLAPVVNAVDPVSGEAGTQVTISGSNFGGQVSGVSAVTIGGVSAGIVSWSDTEIKATVPAGLAAGVKELLIVSASGTGTMSSAPVLFTVVQPPPVLTGGSFIPTGSIGLGRYGYTATMLNNGTVLIAGGQSGAQGDVARADLYDPVAGVFSETGSMSEGREGHVAVKLADGKVLIAGGANESGYVSSANVYDPATSVFTVVGSMSMGRYGAAAVLLPDGRVLVAGGRTDGNVEAASAEIYDPASGQFSHTGSMLAGRAAAGGVLLPNGKALIVGGSASMNSFHNSAELYDPVTGVFSATGFMAETRYWVKMALLDTGKVLVLGGTTAGAELYDPATGTFSRTGGMSTGRLQSAVVKLDSGNVLVAGGGGSSTAEIYNVAGGVFGETVPMLAAHDNIDGVKLADGRVLVASGYGGGYQTSAELFVPGGSALPVPVVDVIAPASGEAGVQVTITGTLFGEQVAGVSAVTIGSVSAEVVSWSDTQIVIKVPAGLTAGEKDLVVAKAVTGGILQSSASKFTVVVPAPVLETGAFVPTGPIGLGRYGYTATMLDNGKVLIAGGQSGAQGDVSRADLYDPVTGVFSETGSMSEGREGHVAVKLADGKVLIAGGANESGYVSSANVYDPATGVFTIVASMSMGRYGPAAVLLPDGRVLMAGGRTDGNVEAASAEIYDPASGQFSPTGSMLAGRAAAGGVLLPNGKALIVGGSASMSSFHNSAELYDPVTGVFSATGFMAETRYWVKLTLLNNGKVLVVGGTTAGAELYDPATGAFSATGSMSTGRLQSAVVKLDSGNVLVAGGGGSSTAEIYNVAGGVFGGPVNMLSGHDNVDGVRLADGRVLVASGYGGGYQTSAELFVPDGWTPPLPPPLPSHPTAEISVLFTPDYSGVMPPASSAELAVQFTPDGYPAVQTASDAAGVLTFVAQAALSPSGDPVTVIVDKAPADDTDGAIALAGDAELVPVSDIYKAGPDGTVFSPAADMVFKYSEPLPDGTQETALVPYRYDAQNGVWTALPVTARDTEANIIYAKVDHLCLFGVFASTASAPAAFLSAGGAVVADGATVTIGSTGTVMLSGNSLAARLVYSVDADLVSSETQYSAPFTLAAGTHTVHYAAADVQNNRSPVKTAIVVIAGAVIAVPPAEILPSSGPIGVPFTITGTGFGTYSAATTKVLVGGVAAPLTLWNDTQIKGTVPGTLAAGAHAVTVVRGTSTLADAGTFQVLAAQAGEVLPSSGAIGVPFTINGANFGNYVANYTRVLIGGTTCPLTLWTDTQIKGTVPGALAAGDYELVVERELNGGAVATQPLAFKVVAPELYAIIPTSGSIGVGFTLTGANFGNYVANYTRVLIGGATAPLTLWADSQIKGTVPGSLVSGTYDVAVERELNGSLVR
ncbi:MAG: IPT/TIG domain-containing protein, partial [Elusimicrobia bacterium]|nr:IPT/TIG domain-containing protein [Elusimicrobiota bacterium]